MLRLFPCLALLLSAPLCVPLTGCGCGPTGQTDAELAPLVFTSSVSRIEVPATIFVRSGTPEVEVRIPDCASMALSGATIEILDAAGEPLARSSSGSCRAQAFVSGAASSSNVELRVVVSVPDGTAAAGEVELVTFQDVCASVGASDIVAFGT